MELIDTPTAVNAALLSCRPPGFPSFFASSLLEGSSSASASRENNNNNLSDEEQEEDDDDPDVLPSFTGHYEPAPYLDPEAYPARGRLRAEISSRHRLLVETAVETRAGTLVAVERGKDPELMLEGMPLYVRVGVRLLFAGTTKRHSRFLKSKEVEEIFRKRSILEGVKFDSTRHALRRIEHFVRAYHVDCSELLEPNLAMYRTLNEFFFRKLRPSARPIASPSDPTVISSSADCRLTVYSDVESAQEFWIKGRNFSLVDLLQDDDMANYFEGGEIACFRLAPKDYHRYHSPVDAVVGPTKFIHGEYLTVNPTVVNNASLDVFTTNKRDVTYLHVSEDARTDGPPTIVAFVQIGAMLVGSIRQTARQGAQVQRGDELGYFAYGGSTIVAVFPRRSVRWDQDLLTNSKVPVETLVKVGERIGVWR